MRETRYRCDNCRAEFRPVDPMCSTAPGVNVPCPIALVIRTKEIDLCAECEDRIINVLSTDLRARFNLEKRSPRTNAARNK